MSEELEPPRKLSLVISHPYYRPDFARVGVKLDGQERNDVQTYNADTGRLETINRQVLHGIIEPFWRYSESRQMRRARERWERKQ